LARAEEGVYHRRERTGIDEIHRGEYFIITYVHALTDGARHTRKADAELSVELFSDTAHPAIAEVVNIIYFSPLVHQADQVNNDGNNILAGQHEGFIAAVQSEFTVDFITANFTEVVALIGEKQYFDNAPCRFLIRGIGTAQLTIDIGDRFNFRTCRILLQGIVDYGIILVNILFLKDDYIRLRIQDTLNVIVLEHDVAIEDNFITLDGNHLSGILIHKIFSPTAEHSSSEFSTDGIFKIFTGYGHLISKAKYIEDGFVGIISDCTQKRSNGEFFFLSIYAYMTLLMSVANSIQAPLKGITRAE